MSKYSKRVFEMIVRAQVFRNTIQELIAKGSPVEQGFKKVETAVNRVVAQSTMQTSGQNTVRVSSEERTSAREGLREHLESLTRTASSMGLKQFFMPRDRGERALVDVAKLFVQLAEPIKEEFVKRHVPEDFIDRLKGGIASVEKAIQQNVAGKGSRRAATLAIAAAQAEAVAELGRLDPLMDNLLWENEPLRTAWHAARRIEKVRTVAKEEKPEEPRAA